jgi:type IV secretion system protein VirB10
MYAQNFADTEGYYSRRGRGGKLSPLDKEEIPFRARPQGSPYQVLASTFIPIVLVNAINSDSPGGKAVGEITHDVYDSATGEHLLVPQGTKVMGSYDREIGYGQERLGIIWERIIFPFGRGSLWIEDAPGTDEQGAAGAPARVNTRFWSRMGKALLVSAVAAGVELGTNSSDYHGDDPLDALSRSVSQYGGRIVYEQFRRDLDRPPTLELDPGMGLNLQVTRDWTFPGTFIRENQPRREP